MKQHSSTSVLPSPAPAGEGPGVRGPKPSCLPGRGMAHHWQYSTPSGPIVAATCKHCGAARRDRVDPHAGGSWAEWYGLPEETKPKHRRRADGASDYYPTALQERDR